MSDRSVSTHAKAKHNLTKSTITMPSNSSEEEQPKTDMVRF